MSNLKTTSQNSKLSSEDVRHVAFLANLKLTNDEVNKFKKQLSNILEYVEKLKKVNTKDVKPTSQVTGLKNVTKKDKVDKNRYIPYKGYYKTRAIFNG